MKITYISEIDFSKPNASSNRIIYNSKSIELNSEHKITLIGVGNIKKTNVDGFVLYNIKNKYQVILRHLFFILRGIISIYLIYKNRIKADVIIYYGSSCRYLIPLFIYCKINRTKLLCDVVEWYDYSHLPLGRFGPIALDTYISMNYLIKKTDGIIVISSYLERFYKKYNKNIVKIPVLIDSSSRLNSISNIYDNKNINIIYAGYPGKKDLLKNIINAVDIVNKENICVKLHLLGPTKKYIKSISNNKISNNTIIYESVNQKDVYNYLINANYSIIIRPQMRFANAGFPTKFVESLNAGVPVIANITSDIGLYLKENHNGFIIEGTTTECIAHKLKEIHSIPKNKLNSLKINAKNCAINNFDYKKYSTIWHNFIIKTMKQ